MGGGGAYIRWSLRGDHGEYTAPASQPVISTRGQLDESDPKFTVDGSWTFDDEEMLFVFVHGLNTDAEGARDQAYTAELGGDRIRPASVISYSWDSDTSWNTAKQNATANGELLAAWLIEWAERDGRPLHLLGYSLGARVSCEALNILVSNGYTDIPASVSLLGGAIPDDSVTERGPYGDAIATTTGPVNNFHSRNDRVLGWVYRIGDRNRAVGYDGISDPNAAPTGYTDIDVTALVDDHYTYFHPEDGCLPRVVERLG